MKNVLYYKKRIIAGIIIIVIIGIIIFGVTNKQSSNNGPAIIDGIECNSMEQAVFHIHAHLDIIINGQQHPIPAQIGILDNKCLYWLHTHDQSGIIHIEAPQQQTFTVGQFIDIWNSTQNIMLQYGAPRIFVNGQEVYTKLSDTVLNAHDEVVIVYGTMPHNIPWYYEFPPGL